MLKRTFFITFFITLDQHWSHLKTPENMHEIMLFFPQQHVKSMLCLFQNMLSHTAFRVFL